MAILSKVKHLEKWRTGGYTLLRIGELHVAVSGDLASFDVDGLAGGELDAGLRFRLAVQLDKANVVSLAENIAGLLAKISVHRRSHVLQWNYGITKCETN